MLDVGAFRKRFSQTGDPAVKRDAFAPLEAVVILSERRSRSLLAAGRNLCRDQSVMSSCRSKHIYDTGLV
jgi:hypothetical protein